MFSKQELQVMGNLIMRADIKGGDAQATAILLQKIDGIIKDMDIPKEDKPKEEPKA